MQKKREKISTQLGALGKRKKNRYSEAAGPIRYDIATTDEQWVELGVIRCHSARGLACLTPRGPASVPRPGPACAARPSAALPPLIHGASLVMFNIIDKTPCHLSKSLVQFLRKQNFVQMTRLHMSDFPLKCNTNMTDHISSGSTSVPRSRGPIV